MQVNDGQREDGHEKWPDRNVDLIASDVENENSSSVGECENGKDDLDQDGRVRPEAGAHLADSGVELMLTVAAADCKRSNAGRTRGSMLTRPTGID